MTVKITSCRDYQITLKLKFGRYLPLALRPIFSKGRELLKIPSNSFIITVIHLYIFVHIQMYIIPLHAIIIVINIYRVSHRSRDNII